MEKTTVKIFFASSAEMNEERTNSVLILNQINKSHPHLHLEPVHWEYDMVYGSYPDFSNVQDAINPKLKESQLCVFMFYSKIGKFTREEFELADALQKKVIPFFKEGFSPRKPEIATFTELLDFRESLSGKVLSEKYTTMTEFELALKDSLHLYLAKEFALPNENKSLSTEMTSLLKVLGDYQREIEELKENQADPDTANRIASLELQKQELTDQLNQSKEIQAQQAKDKSELESRLAPQIAKDNLKQKAFTAIQENRYDDAESLLKESAKESVFETASTFYELGKLKKIQLVYREALRYFELAVNINSNDFNMNMEAGNMLRDLGYNDKAIFHFEQAQSLLQAQGTVNQSDLCYVSNELGVAYRNKGEYDKAFLYFSQSLDIAKNLYGEESAVVATEYTNLGLACRSRGAFDKAIDYHKMSLDIIEKIFDKADGRLAVHYNNLGAAYNSKGAYDVAIGYIEKALTIDQNYYANNNPNLAAYYNNLGFSYGGKDEYDMAIKYYDIALGIDKNLYGEEHPDIAIRYNNLGLTYYNKGDNDKAIDYYEKALAIDKKFHGESHPDIAIDYNNLGKAYDSKEEYDIAIDYYEKAYAIIEKFYAEEHSETVINRRHLANSYSKKRMHDKAILYLKKAIAINEIIDGENTFLAIDYNSLGNNYFVLEMYPEAILCYENALTIYGKHPFEKNDENIIIISENLAGAKEIQEKTGK